MIIKNICNFSISYNLIVDIPIILNYIYSTILKRNVMETTTTITASFILNGLVIYVDADVDSIMDACEDKGYTYDNKTLVYHIKERLEITQLV